MPTLGELNFKDPSLDVQLKKDDNDDDGGALFWLWSKVVVAVCPKRLAFPPP